MSRRLQQLVHVGCRELGIDADTRHDIQQQVTGKASLSDMTEPELQLVINHLKERGFEVKGGRKRHKRAPRADLRLVHVLWRKLADAGELERPDRAGLNAFVRSRFENTWGSVPADIDMLREHGQINDVIEALKHWCARADVPLDRNW